MVQTVISTIKERLEAPDRWGNFINGGWVPPAKGNYFVDTTPISGDVVGEFARSTAEDVEQALNAAHAAKGAWGKTPPAARAAILNKIADRIEANSEILALAETLDNGKPLRESVAADLPLTVDQFRYFASVIRVQEGFLSEVDEHTVAYHFHEPLGVVAQIIPWNFPLLMASWKLAPALAAGNTVVLKPAEQTPLSILLVANLIKDLLPPGVLNIVTGFGPEVGAPLAASARVDKVAFTGSTQTGQLIQEYSGPNLIPVTLELGGKAPNIFFSDILDADDEFLDKALEAAVSFALNQGEVCTAPSRALIQESIFDEFIERVVARVKTIRQGNPFDFATQIGAQVSQEQFAKILDYIDIGKTESELLVGGSRAAIPGFEAGYFIQPNHSDSSKRDWKRSAAGPRLPTMRRRTPTPLL